MARLKLALLFVRAAVPMAMFCWPVVLLASAKEPIATFQPPLALSRRALKPTAVLALPVERLDSALFPTAVFRFRSQLLVHSAALSGDENAKQQSAIATVKRPQRKGVRLKDLVTLFIFLFCWNLPS